MPSGIDFNLNNIVNGLQDVIKLDQTIKDVQSKAREKIVITTSVSPKSTKDIISLKNNIKDLKAQKQELYELDSKMSNGAKDSNYTNTFNDLVRDIDSAINQANDKIDDFKSYVKSFASDLRVSFDNARISLEDIINTGDVDKALLLFSNLYYSIYNLKNIDPDLSIVDSEDIREAEILRDIFDSLSSILSGEMDEDYFDNLKRGMNSLGLEISDIEEKLRKSFSSKAIQNAIDDLTTKIDSIKQKVSGHQYVDTDEIEKEREELNGLVSDLEKLTTIDSKFKKSISSVKGLLTKESKKMSIASDANKSNISSVNSIVESQNKIQKELKETQKQAEETSKAILKVTAYRGTNGGDPVTSNKSGATFWDSKKNVANMYGTNSSDKTLWSSELSFNNPLVIDAKKQKYGDISYLGDGADKASKAILELTKRENQLRESLEKSTKSGLEEVAMAYELQDVCRQIKKISDDTSNPYGTHSSDWFAEYAKNNGYDGLHIKNVLDTPDSYAKNGTEVSDVFVTFQREQLENTVLLAKANKDLAESEREVALAELGVVKNTKPPIKDVFQGETSSAGKLEEEIKNVTSATEKASESAKEYGKVLSQVGLAGMQFDDEGNQIPSKYSYTRQTGKNQVQTITIKYEQDEESGEIVQREYIGEYITGFQALEKEIDKADKKVYELKKNLASNKAKFGDNYDSSALESLVANAENEANMLYEALKKVYDEQSEYEYSIAQYAEERAKKQEEYNTQLKNSKNIEDARAKNASDKKNESDEKKRLTNIEQVNRALNKQQIAIDSIEKTYNKSVNPDLDREVSNQQDLVELANKKAQIQAKINSLQGQERTSANEKEFLELEKLIAEYKELAKYKLKSNNPSKQELGGQNLQTLIQTQISLYDKLIIKAEQYGDETADVVKKLKEQRDILSKIDADGKYTATADDYYASRDTYKVEKASLSAYEAEAKAAEKQWNAIKAAREKSEKKAKTNQSLKQSETDKAAKEQLSAYEKIKKLKFEISKTTDTDTLSSLKAQLKIEQDRYLNATKILKANSDYFDKDAQNLKITQARLEAEQRIAQYKKNQSDNQAKEQQKAIEAARKESLKKSESEQKAKQSETDKALKDQLNAYKKIQEIKYKLSYTEDDGERSKLLERQKLYQEEFANAGKILSANSELYSIEQQTNELTKVRLEYEEKIAKYKADQRENQLSSIQNSVESYLGDYKKRNNGRPVDPNRSHEYQQLLDKYKASIDALQVKKDELSKQPTISEDDLDSVKKMTDAVEENKNALIAMSAAEKGSTEGSRRKEIDKITKYLKDNTRISEEAKTKLKEYLDLLRNGGADVNVDEIHNQFLKVTEAERLAGNEGKKFLDVIRDKAWYGWAAQIASYFSLQDIIRYFKEGATVVKEFDDGLTNISYTMDVTKSQLDGIGQSVLDLSKDLKSSIDNSMQVAKIYANMNTTAEEIKKLSEPTLIMSNLTGFDASTMADDIQAVTQQFEIAAEDSMHIADVYDTISRNISVDYSKILELTLETM